MLTYLLFLIFFGTIKSSMNTETIESFNETISCSSKAGMASIYVDEALYNLYLQTNFNHSIQNISDSCPQIDGHFLYWKVEKSASSLDDAYANGTIGLMYDAGSEAYDCKNFSFISNNGLCFTLGEIKNGSDSCSVVFVPHNEHSYNYMIVTSKGCTGFIDEYGNLYQERAANDTFQFDFGNRWKLAYAVGCGGCDGLKAKNLINMLHSRNVGITFSLFNHTIQESNMSLRNDCSIPSGMAYFYADDKFYWFVYKFWGTRYRQIMPTKVCSCPTGYVLFWHDVYSNYSLNYALRSYFESHDSGQYVDYTIQLFPNQTLYNNNPNVYNRLDIHSYCPHPCICTYEEYCFSWEITLLKEEIIEFIPKCTDGGCYVYLRIQPFGETTLRIKSFGCNGCENIMNIDCSTKERPIYTASQMFEKIQQDLRYSIYISPDDPKYASGDILLKRPPFNFVFIAMMDIINFQFILAFMIAISIAIFVFGRIKPKYPMLIFNQNIFQLIYLAYYKICIGYDNYYGNRHALLDIFASRGNYRCFQNYRHDRISFILFVFFALFHSSIYLTTLLLTSIRCISVYFPIVYSQKVNKKFLAKLILVYDLIFLLVILIVATILSLIYQIDHFERNKKQTKFFTDLELDSYLYQDLAYAYWEDDYEQYSADKLYLHYNAQDTTKIVMNLVDGIVVLISFTVAVLLIVRLVKHTLKNRDDITISSLKIAIAIFLQNIISILVTFSLYTNLIMFIIKPASYWINGPIINGTYVWRSSDLIDKDTTELQQRTFASIMFFYNEALDAFIQIGLFFDLLVTLFVFTEYRQAIINSIAFVFKKSKKWIFKSNSTSVGMYS